MQRGRQVSGEAVTMREFTRLVPDSISWTANNRTHMIRVPDAPRLEFRLPDAGAHP